jgi:hypothetical protein
LDEEAFSLCDPSADSEVEEVDLDEVDSHDEVVSLEAEELGTKMECIVYSL